MAKADTDTGYRRGPLRTVWPSPARVVSRRAARRADEEYGSSAQPSWRNVDWPAHLHDVEIDGERVHYADLGEGEAAPVVFVHGLGGSWQNWLETLPTIAQTRRAIALDLPGFGASEMPAEPITITNFAKAVEGLCAALDLGAVPVVGNSMGGFTAAEVAIRHPDRVERLVLVDAAGISIAQASQTSVRLGRLLLGGSGSASAERGRRLLKRPGYVQFAFGVIMRHPTRIAHDLLVEQLIGVGKPGFRGAMEALLTYDIRDRLADIAAPTLIVQGTDDVLVPRGDAQEFERLIPRATSLVLEDTGHVPMLERPTTFNRALLEFLDQDVAPEQPSSQQEPVLSEGRERAV